MKKNNTFKILIIIGLFLIIQGCTLKQNEKVNQTESGIATKKSEIVSFSGARGDLVEEPIEDECQRVFENYIQSKQFKKKYSDCQLIESKVGRGENECVNYSPQGCYICDLECTFLES